MTNPVPAELADDGTHRPVQTDNGPEPGMEPVSQDPNWTPEVTE